ncbi:MAG: M28 family metallopeptidase [Candidatus Hodarchaeota archaeon]
MHIRRGIIIILLHFILSFHVLYAVARYNPANYDEKDVNPIIIEMIGQVEFKNLSNTISHFQAYGNRYSWEKQWQAANWIEKSLKDYKIKAFIQTYEYKGKVWPNIIATIEGSDNPDQIIMLLAHFDSISDDPTKKIAPGADDNASGVAVLMEIARILKDFPIKRTVMLCFFSNEETGRVGSEYSAHLFKMDNLNIKAVINLDVLGYNRPKITSPLEAVRAGYSLRNRAKIIYRAAQNSLNGLLNGSDVVKIGGRQENGNLVAVVARIFRQYANINVKEIIDDKCK